MIYLIGKIFVYLLLALGVGAAAGWLWRNLQAVDRESALERQLMELRGRLPQMETALRKRDEQLDAAHGELRAREEASAGLAELTAERDRLAAELERLRAQPAAAGDTATGEILDSDLGETPASAEDASAATNVAAAANVAAATELTEVREALERANKALQAEQRRVEELSRERELQNRALQALEQQLEMARDGHDRVVNG
ncbi:MAG: hypothetical protein U5Q16_02605 [Gammaproteobacteria bacterium]|nr:hypothetical protein [Gammaproteobacteria bacterium]